MISSKYNFVDKNRRMGTVDTPGHSLPLLMFTAVFEDVKVAVTGPNL